jgi:ubiquinone biosynthesis O-methyltransferase
MTVGSAGVDDSPSTVVPGDIPVIEPEAYDRWRATDLGRITDDIELSLITELLGDVKGKSVLDIGCGDGVLAVRLAQQGARVVGIDASPAMIRAASKRAAEAGVTVEFLIGRAESLPFRDASFDIVTAVTVLCFIADPSHTFDEVSRVIKAGGRFVIGELGRFSTWAVQRRIRAWLGSPLWRRGRFRTPWELRRLASTSGLTPIQVRGAVYYPRSSLAARWLSRWDPLLGRITTFGAAFLALNATKPA